MHYRHRGEAFAARFGRCADRHHGPCIVGTRLRLPAAHALDQLACFGQRQHLHLRLGATLAGGRLDPHLGHGEPSVDR